MYLTPSNLETFKSLQYELQARSPELAIDGGNYAFHLYIIKHRVIKKNQTQ